MSSSSSSSWEEPACWAALAEAAAICACWAACCICIHSCWASSACCWRAWRDIQTNTHSRTGQNLTRQMRISMAITVMLIIGTSDAQYNENGAMQCPQYQHIHDYRFSNFALSHTLANNSCCCLRSSSSGMPRFSSRELAFLLFSATVLHSCRTSFTSVM